MKMVKNHFDKNLFHRKGYKVTKLISKLQSKWWTNSSISRLLISSETLAQSTDSQVAANHEMPALKKMLTWLTIWF